MEVLDVLGTLHVPVLLVTVAAILYSDHKALAYMLGREQMLSRQFVRWSHGIVWVGLLAMIVTGVALTLPALEYRLGQAAFYVKMGFVLVLVMNAFAIGRISKMATATPFNALSDEQRSTLLVSGGLSVFGWVGAILTAVFFL